MVRAWASRVLRPVVAKSTYARFAYLLAGAMLTMACAFVWSWIPNYLYLRAPDKLFVELCVGFAMSTVLGLFSPARSACAVLAKKLLGGPITAFEVPPATTWNSRLRAGLWMLLHAGLGTGVGTLVMFWQVYFRGLMISGLSWLGVPFQEYADTTSEHLLSALEGIGLAVLGCYLIAGIGALLARLAPTLLGPSASERVRTVEQRVRNLAERNRVASELHDSVGHALSVVTLQAGAGAKVLDQDPEFAREALQTIEGTTREALEDLDRALGILRDGRPRDVNSPRDLSELGQLARSTDLAGLDVRTEIVGPVDDVPPLISHETYRVAQEGLTNALHHAGEGTTALRVTVGDDSVRLELENPLGSTKTSSQRRSSGLGSKSIRQRIEALGGSMTSAAEGSSWRLDVRLPL